MMLLFLFSIPRKVRNGMKWQRNTFSESLKCPRYILEAEIIAILITGKNKSNIQKAITQKTSLRIQDCFVHSTNEYNRTSTIKARLSPHKLYMANNTYHSWGIKLYYYEYKKRWQGNS